MTQNQNRMINQFLQGNSTNHKYYTISINNINSNDHYFSKNIKKKKI